MAGSLAWITAPHRLPWVVLSLMVTSLAALAVAGVLLVAQARLDARQTAQEAAQTAAHDTTCQILRLQSDPNLPAPSTDRGRAALGVYREAYGQLDCTPELKAQRPAVAATP